jgi:glyoxylate reductase
MDAEILDAGPRLRVIADYAAGFDNIDVAAATERGIPVTNTLGVLTETTADMAFALLMACARRIVEADQFMCAGKYEGWGPMLFLGTDIHGRTLGLVGFGRIAQAMARRGAGFNTKIPYRNCKRAPEELERAYHAEYRELPDLLQESDFVSLHVPLTESTYHLISDAKFQLMKRTAILTNTSRGPVVNEMTLVKALRDGMISGSGLDVFEREPRFEPGLEANVVMVPHMVSASVETRTKMAIMAAKNACAAIREEMPPNIVNPRVWEHRRR